MYRHTNTGPKSLKVTERPMYGSKRIGSYTGQKELAVAPTITNYPYTQPMLAPLKRYELTDHLGNVATVVTGRLLDGAGAGSGYSGAHCATHSGPSSASHFGGHCATLR